MAELVISGKDKKFNGAVKQALGQGKATKDIEGF